MLFFLCLQSSIHYFNLPFLGRSFPGDRLKELNNYLKQNYDIFLFGSSVINHSNIKDIDTRSISQMLQSMQRNHKIANISRGAYELNIFSHFFEYITKCNSKPELYIFEINLRSFSPEWDRRPEYQFEKEIAILKSPNLEFIYHMLSDYNYNFETITQNEFNQTPVYKWQTQIGLVKDFTFEESPVTDLGTKKKLIFFYLYKLDETNSKIDSLKRLITISKNNKTKLLFYLTPIDWEAGQEYLPNDFEEITSKNILLIKSILLNNKMPFLDLSYSLGSSFFSYDKYPNEHLNENGRFFVANELSGWIENNLFTK